MKPIHTRDQLLALVARNAPTTACGRAIREQGATVLGGFNPVESLPGWVVQVNRWTIAILCDEQAQVYKVRYLDAIPWQNWLGRIGGRDPLRDGDKPYLSALKRMQARNRYGTIIASPTDEGGRSGGICESKARIGRNAADSV